MQTLGQTQACGHCGYRVHLKMHGPSYLQGKCVSTHSLSCQHASKACSEGSPESGKWKQVNATSLML